MLADYAIGTLHKCYRKWGTQSFHISKFHQFLYKCTPSWISFAIFCHKCIFSPTIPMRLLYFTIKQNKRSTFMVVFSSVGSHDSIYPQGNKLVNFIHPNVFLSSFEIFTSCFHLQMISHNNSVLFFVQVCPVPL